MGVVNRPVAWVPLRILLKGNFAANGAKVASLALVLVAGSGSCWLYHHVAD
jgi:hypothetical protein